MNEHPTIPEPVNVIVRALLRSPLHWAMSHNTMLLAVTGRTTGRVYQVPVSYTRDGHDLVCFTDSRWWKNLRDGAPVTAAIRGRRRNGIAQAVSGPAVAEHLACHLRIVPRDAKYHGVRLGPRHEPNAADLARAAHTTAMIRIRLHEPR
ncbi:MAG: nitroreductase/quinone reductase family protein [Trebonia sp.]